MILIADCHASHRRGNEAEFVQMLEHLARTAQDVVFLGDILEFWIALPGYEEDLHRRFLDWCRRESGRRQVGFVEGNHEFFVARQHATAFSFCAPDEHLDGAGRLFIHGDTVNRADRSHRLLRGVTKSRVICWAEQVVPGATWIAKFIKNHFEARRQAMPKYFPEAQVKAFASACFARGVKAVYMGHFHEARVTTTPAGCLCQVLPPWCGTGLVGILSESGGQAAVRRWQDIPVGP
jgi:UDP-2,3-diacylglucosamine pyrophosphatase LpxH